MEQKDFKGGEWCIFEFKVGQVKQVKPYFAFSDSVVEISGQLWDRCVPLTLENKAIADHYGYYKDRIHKEGSRGLNFPDIHRWLVEHWYVTTTQVPSKTEDKHKWFGGRWEEVREFVEEMVKVGKGESTYGFSYERR